MKLLVTTKLFAPYLFLADGTDKHKYDLFIIVPILEGQTMKQLDKQVDKATNAVTLKYRINGDGNTNKKIVLCKKKVTFELAQELSDYLYLLEMDTAGHGQEDTAAYESQHSNGRNREDHPSFENGTMVEDEAEPTEEDYAQDLPADDLVNMVKVEVSLKKKGTNFSQSFALPLESSNRLSIEKNQKVANMCPYIFMEELTAPSPGVQFRAIVPLKGYQIAEPALQIDKVDPVTGRYSKEITFLKAEQHDDFFVPSPLVYSTDGASAQDGEYSMLIKLADSPSLQTVETYSSVKAKTKNSDTRYTGGGGSQIKPKNRSLSVNSKTKNADTR